MIVLVIVDLRARSKLDGLKPSSLEAGQNRTRVLPDIFWLICWSLGGLLAMSLIPSKRVDRIFPVIPPLCLLLAAQIGAVSRNEQWRERVYRWTAAALLLSILFIGGYALSKVVLAYRGHRDALVVFGRNVRKEVAAHHWRYEAIKGSDEGMLLYLERTHFIEPGRAVVEWNRGNLDALVVPAGKAPDLMRQLRDAALSSLRSTERKNDADLGYVLITR